PGLLISFIDGETFEDDQGYAQPPPGRYLEKQGRLQVESAVGSKVSRSGHVLDIDTFFAVHIAQSQSENGVRGQVHGHARSVLGKVALGPVFIWSSPRRQGVFEFEEIGKGPGAEG